MANITIDQLTGKISLPTDQLEVQATAGGASNKVTVGSAVLAGMQTLPAPIANAGILSSTGYSLTGSAATSMVNLAGTWSTTGNPVLFKIAATDTASGATTKFVSFLAGVAGATEVFNVTKAGLVTCNAIKGASASTLTISSFNPDTYQLTLDAQTLNFARAGTNVVKITYNKMTVNGTIVGESSHNNAGLPLTVRGGDCVTGTGNHPGGALYLVGGTPYNTAAGGNVYIDGGASTDGTPTNVIVGETRGYLITVNKTFSTLASAAVAGVGARSYITDGAATPVFSNAAGGGGTLGTPVYSDGTTWRNG